MNTSTYDSRINYEINKSKKAGNVIRTLYYMDARRMVHAPSFEIFKKGLAYRRWLNQNESRIKNLADLMAAKCKILILN